MTDPSKERIAAALRLAEAVDRADELGWPMPGSSVDPLSAYRATLPRIRSRAEVEREFCEVLNAAPSAVYGGGEVKFLGVDAGRVANLRLELDRARLSEPTTDSGPSSVDTPDPPPVPVSPAGADLLGSKRVSWEPERNRQIVAALKSVPLRIRIGSAWALIEELMGGDADSGPPGVVAAKESTDNAAALEGAALEDPDCNCDQALVLTEKLDECRKLLRAIHGFGKSIVDLSAEIP